MKCLGCGRSISWDGKGTLCFTCPCGATMFIDDKTDKIALPVSFIMSLQRKKNILHIDYYLGISDHQSPQKQAVYEQLKRKGAVWSWECRRCKDRFIRHVKMQAPKRFNLHPELQKLMPIDVL